MTPESALIELLERVGTTRGKAVLVSDHELNGWPSVALKAMKSQGLITKARPASSAVCPGCERECVMPVHTQPDKSRKAEPFIVCDKRSDINRVAVPTGRLVQWQCTIDGVCGFIADSLALRRNRTQPSDTDLWEIGIASGDKRSQMLCLKPDGGLSIVAGNNSIQLAELIDYQDGTYGLDATKIHQLVDATTTADNRYTPSNARRETRKLETQARYENWQKQYRALKKSRPNMPDTWYSQQIAKMDIAQGRDADTIRKHMKK
jgi:hypothetical protein